MTSVQDRDQNPVSNFSDVADLYQPTRDYNPSFGVEEEAFYLIRDTLGQITDAMNKRLFDEAQKSASGNDGFSLSPEPNAAQAEHVSKPQTLENIISLFEEMQFKRARINEIMREMNAMRCPFSTMPHITGDQAFDNIIKPSVENPERGVRQRYLMQAFFKAMPNSPYYPILNTALHYTTAVKDMDDDLVKGRRAQFLMPFLLTLMENRSPFNKVGGTLTKVFNQSMQPRLNLGARGGIDANYFHASNGEELAQLKFQDVLNTEMMAHYSFGFLRNKHSIPKFNVTNASVKTLPKYADFIGKARLGHRTNFLMARTQQWKWLKTKNLYDDVGQAHTLLQERRDFDPGIHQLQTMTLVLAAIDHGEGVAEQVDELLAKYGFDESKWSDNGLMLLENSLKSAFYRGNEAFHGTSDFMNIRYGNGNMQTFGQEFLRIVEKFYKDLDAKVGSNLSDKLEPMRYIIETGRTDAQVARDLIREPDDNFRFIREFDPAWFERPDQCFGMLVDNGELKLSPS